MGKYHSYTDTFPDSTVSNGMSSDVVIPLVTVEWESVKFTQEAEIKQGPTVAADMISAQQEPTGQQSQLE